MKEITVYGLNSDRKAILESIQRLECVEFANVENEILSKPDTKEKLMSFERHIANTTKALDELNAHCPEKSKMFALRKEISADEYSLPTTKREQAASISNEINLLAKKISENNLENARAYSKIENLKYWESLDVPMNFSGTQNSSTAIYTYPNELTVEMLDGIIADHKDSVYYEIVSASKEISCVFFICLKKDFPDVVKLLRENGFVQPSGLTHRTAHDKIAQIQQSIELRQEENEQKKQKITSFAQNRDDLKLYLDYLMIRKEKYLSLERVSLTQKAFVIHGYVPADRIKDVDKVLKGFDCCAYEFEDADGDDIPVLFKNNSFVSPVEDITRSYSMPSKNDIDPNWIMSIFYYFFFGMMFSDAGYGLLMVLVTGYLGFVRKVEKGTRQFMRMFFFCGISTTFWGIMYGSFFGDVIKGIKPLWLNPVEEPLKLLIFSVSIGVFQIVIGLMLKFYVDFRSGEKVSAIFDTGSWILILLGAAVAICGNVFASGVLSKIGIALVAIGVIMILTMKDRSTKNPFKRLFSGILGLYDVTSYISDSLSYSRLMALGLSTGVIAQVINIMGSLAGDSIFGKLVFVLVFVLGHAVNFAINVLGAYVHTNRLQYVEFYSKFYEGGGREFAPLKMNTKYYNFTEVKNND